MVVVHIEMNHAVVAGVDALGLRADVLLKGLHILVPRGHHHVEDQVDLLGSGDAAQVVEHQALVPALEVVVQLCGHPIRLRVAGHNGIHVDADGDVQLRADFPLRLVDHLVQLQDVAVGGHLRMNGGHAAAGAVVVEDQVVGAQDLVVLHQHVDDSPAQLLVRLAAHEAVDGVLAHIEARFQHQRRHDHAHHAVHREGREHADNHAQRHGGGGQHVGEGVLGGGQQGRGVDLLPHMGVEEVQPDLHQNAEDQQEQRYPAEGRAHGMQDAVHAGEQQLHTHEQDQHAHPQRAQVFHAAVAEGMLPVHGLLRQADGNQRNNAAPRVGEVVGRVRRHRHGAGERAHQEFHHGQKHVHRDAHHRAQCAVLPAHPLVGGVLRLTDKQTDDPLDHDW